MPVISAPTKTAVSSPTHRKNADLPELLKQYAAAALGVAGLTAMASAQVPGHNIIYTPADLAIDTHPSTQIPIDFNHDGSPDIFLSAHHFTDFFSGGLGFDGYGRIDGSLGSAASVIASHALPKGMIIDKGGQFKNKFVILASATSGSYLGATHKQVTGAFANIKNKYLGVRFQINGKVHEGWVRFTLASSGTTISGTMSGYAFDTVPNEVGLAAGQIGGRVGPGNEGKIYVKDSVPSTLGMLAAGSSAISYWRK